MVDNLEVGSTASSNISESLRAQILGTGYRRGKYRPRPASRTSPNNAYGSLDSAYEVIPSQEHEITPKEDSFHTAPTGSSQALVPIPEDPPLQNQEQKRSNTKQTQNVGIQTVSAGADSESDCCCCGDYEYYEEPQVCCCKCRRHEDSSDEATESTYPPMVPKRRNHYCCHCRKSRKPYRSPSEILSDSDDSYTTDFLDLPYQNNEEYLKLLKELEKKLIARNKERVRRTMMEFEKRSRQNQNLEKPVCHYDSPKMSRKKHKNSICCKCGRSKRINSDIMQNEKKWEEMERDTSPVPNRFDHCSKKSQWRIDPRTGEWVKISSEGLKNEESVPVKKECCCRQKKRH